MLQIKDATVIMGQLSRHLAYYADIKEADFSRFTVEARLYALLEHSKFHRETTAVERLKYLFEKMCGFDNIPLRKYTMSYIEQYGRYHFEMEDESLF